MKEKDKTSSNHIEKLRKKAEKQVAKTNAVGGTYSEDSIVKLIHELEVHKIELEMQNEELRYAQNQAREISEKFTALFDYAPMGYFTLDRKGVILELNYRGARMLGKDRNQLHKTNFKMFVSQETLPEFNKFFDNIFKSQTSQTAEIGIISPAASCIDVFIKGVVSHDATQCMIATVDISRRKRAEEALRASEQRLYELNATKDKFFSIIGHDLKSPFNSIIGLSNLLVSKVNQKDYQDVEEYAGYIQTSSYRAMELLNNLLEWSNAQTGKMGFVPQEVDLAKIIDQTIELSQDAARQKSISLNKTIPENAKAWADPTMISTVMRNLISNAIKFTHPRGRIHISLHQKMDELLVAVNDNGVGMKTENRDRLFFIEDSFSSQGTRGESGTGLGLLLCKEFIAMHGGNIWVESEPGIGSTFYFTIPVK